MKKAKNDFTKSNPNDKIIKFIYDIIGLESDFIINNYKISYNDICELKLNKFILKYINIYYLDYCLDCTSLLHDAVYQRDLEIIEFLLENGVDIEIRDFFGATPTMLAFDLTYDSHYEYGEVIALLLKYNPNLNSQNVNGFTALIEAVASSNCEAVEWLLELGVNVNIKDNESKTAIDYINSDLMKKIFNDYEKKDNNY